MLPDFDGDFTDTTEVSPLRTEDSPRRLRVFSLPSACFHYCRDFSVVITCVSVMIAKVAVINCDSFRYLHVSFQSGGYSFCFVTCASIVRGA